MQKKKSTKTPVERGTQGRNDVDYDWIPKETLDHFSKYNLTYGIFLDKLYLYFAHYYLTVI